MNQESAIGQDIIDRILERIKTLSETAGHGTVVACWNIKNGRLDCRYQDGKETEKYVDSIKDKR